MLPGNVSERRITYLTQPEQKSANICVAPQITEILRGYERPVVFGIDKRAVVDRIASEIVVCEPVHHRATTAQSNQRRALRSQIRSAVGLDRQQNSVDKLIQSASWILIQELRPRHKQIGKRQLILGKICAAD